MKRLMLTIISFFMFILFPTFLLAATHYVTPSGAGSKNGNDWNNSYQGLPSSLTRGDTYVIAGGNYSARTFNDAVSGGLVITIRKASSLSAYQDNLVAGWNSTYETTQAVFSGEIDFNSSYYTIDGITPSTGYWQTSGYGIKFTYSNPNQINHLIAATTSNASYITIKHAEFANPGSSYDYEQFAIYPLSSNSGTPVLDNWLVSHCYFHDCNVFIKLAAASPNGWVIEYNRFASNWSSGNNHGEQISIPGIGSTTPHQIRYNWFDPYVGTGSVVYMQYLDRTANNVSIYGNIWNLTGKNSSNCGNGVIGTSDSSASPMAYNYWKIYNNTFMNGLCQMAIGYADTNEALGWEIRNNLFYNAPTTLMYGLPTNGIFSNNYINGGAWGWGTCTNCVTSTVALSTLFPNYTNGDYHLGANSQAIDMGYNLPTPYNIDADGVTRPQGAAFDAGPYEFVTSSSGGTTAIPMPPSLSLVN